WILFDEQYQKREEKVIRIPELTDEDGDSCDSLAALQKFVKETIDTLCANAKYTIRSVNFSAYGASWVYIDEKGTVLTPLYNYLKPYPPSLLQKFFRSYGGETQFSRETCSPVLGSLNSGLQLYRLKYLLPKVYKRLDFALHLPNYLSYLLTGKPYTEITSIGCHTGLWNFDQDHYHDWVFEERLSDYFPTLVTQDTTSVVSRSEHSFSVGVGIHDSSAALVPYLLQMEKPFVLISTGTWNIALNPFTQQTLTTEELENDCLCYLSYEGKPIKASRLFAGHWHHRLLTLLSERFSIAAAVIEQLPFNAELLPRGEIGDTSWEELLARSLTFPNAQQAYHYFLAGLVSKQQQSLTYILNGSDVPQLLVDGGFSGNTIFMKLLAQRNPAMEVYAAVLPQASALGA
ncbi:MAG: carbohydrate kinase, partial [Chitinophagaceae bacterium]